MWFIIILCQQEKKVSSNCRHCLIMYRQFSSLIFTLYQLLLLRSLIKYSTIHTETLFFFSVYQKLLFIFQGVHSKRWKNTRIRTQNRCCLHFEKLKELNNTSTGVHRSLYRLFGLSIWSNSVPCRSKIDASLMQQPPWSFDRGVVD